MVMTYFQAAILGLIQGLTEFLPVSSSGHLALAEALFGLPPSDLLFEIAVHVATLLAIVAYFRKDLWGLARGLVRPDTPPVADMSARRWLGLLVLATIPAGVIGVAFESAVEASFGDLSGVGFRLLATGALLFSTLPLAGTLRRLGAGRALAIGCAQAVALLPGVSRSGSTIAAALWLGVEREQAARFSFLMALPAIGGAFVLQVAKMLRTGAHTTFDQWGPLAVAFIVAGVSGYLAVGLLLRALARRYFAYFGIWCWIVGLAALWHWHA
jgi:undecaprenyl-diphosphatase